MNLHATRRRFLKRSAGLASLPFLSALTRTAEAAGPFGDYRAAVCVFLYGGADSHNIVMPTASSEWNAYVAKRGGIAQPQASVIGLNPVNPGGRTFAMNRVMPKLAQIFNVDRKMAVVGNVGVLLQPTTLAQYKAKSVPLPPQLFSHSDMQSHWQSGEPALPFATGWGGRMADLLYASNAGSPLPVCVSVAGSNQFMVASQAPAAPYQVSPNGPIRIRAWRDWDTGNSNPQKVYNDRIVVPRFNKLEDEYGDIVARSIDTELAVTGALAPIPSFRADFPGTGTDATPTVTNPLADQLRMVARLIAARATFGVKRQVFFVSLGGFDTHGDQIVLEPKLLGMLDDALAAFYRKTVALSVGPNVTTFTASDFGRTYTFNGGGSDHGWGGHHLVVGGSVVGGTLYGTIPVAGLSGNNLTLIDPSNSADLDTGQGRLLPTVATDVYGATFAQWLGITQASELASVFPHLSGFGGNKLGFLG